MPAVASKVSKTLAQRDVLFTPGGKGEFRKQGKPVRGTIHMMPDTPATKALHRDFNKWFKVNAPAYISGSPRL